MYKTSHLKTSRKQYSVLYGPPAVSYDPTALLSFAIQQFQLPRSHGHALLVSPSAAEAGVSYLLCIPLSYPTLSPADVLDIVVSPEQDAWYC